MKTKFYLSALLFTVCTFSIHMNAQLAISETGNVGIAVADSIEPLSTLSIGGAGQSDAKLSVMESGSYSGDRYGVVSLLNTDLQDNNMYSVWGKSTGVAGTLMGVRGEALATSGVVVLPHNIVMQTSAYGVYGIAGGSIRDNYGVFGILQAGGGNGAGVYGTTGGMAPPLIGGRYAGYFAGQTMVIGDLYASDFITVLPFPIINKAHVENGLSNNLQHLTPIQYELQDSIAENSRTHYGFDAKEMQRLFPNLVKEDKSGNISINYVELVPILVQAIQNLSAEVEELKARQ